MSEDFPGGAPADSPAPTPVDALAAPAPSTPASGLALWSMVSGIASFVMAIIPYVSFVAFIPAFVAIGLGIAALVKRARSGKPITGIVLGALAFLIAIGVSVSTVNPGPDPRLPLSDSGGGVPAASEPGAVASSAGSDSSAQASDEPSESPTPVTVPADKAYKGSGDKILAIELPDGIDNAAVATITYSGKRNFTVWSLDSNLDEKDLMVNEIGKYRGTVLFNLSGDEVASLEINASGPWTVTVRSILSLREFVAGAASGHGDDVLVYRGTSGVASLTHKGSSNFVVWNYGNSSDLVVNEIGKYSGETRWSAGPSVVAITADGDWSISVSGQ